MEFLAKARWCL